MSRITGKQIREELEVINKVESKDKTKEESPVHEKNDDDPMKKLVITSEPKIYRTFKKSQLDKEEKIVKLLRSSVFSEFRANPKLRIGITNKKGKMEWFEEPKKRVVASLVIELKQYKIDDV